MKRGYYSWMSLKPDFLAMGKDEPFGVEGKEPPRLSSFALTAF
jgi:hypothetical protein